VSLSIRPIMSVSERRKANVLDVPNCDMGSPNADYYVDPVCALSGSALSPLGALASWVVAVAAFPAWRVKLALTGPDCPAPKFCAGGGTLRLSTPKRP
jgi:hypothetical protein